MLLKQNRDKLASVFRGQSDQHGGAQGEVTNGFEALEPQTINI
jgi:hypothetical protein